MNVLITGGFGYLGGRLAQFLTDQSYKICLGSRNSAVAPLWLPGATTCKMQWESPDDLNQVCKGVDVIVHLAGMNAEACAANPEVALEFCTGATARLLQAAIEQGVKRFICLSTVHVYGSPLSGVVSEDTPPAPVYPYATSRLAGEKLILAAHQHDDIEGIVIRLSNAVGAPAGQDAHCWTLLVNDLCRQAVASKCMKLRSSGEQRRDFVAMHDVVRCIRHMINLPLQQDDSGVFNMGGECSLGINQIAQIIADRCELLLKMTPLISHPAQSSLEQENPVFEYSIAKLKQSGFFLEGSLQDEIDATLLFCQSAFGVER